ncbi:MAG: NYN domain-containing protein [Acidimicrobiales bacterium]
MPFTHVVVDGSNIATEGRSIPSLAQLDEAVREFHNEFPHAEITVVVDATFGHRIDSSERTAFDEAVAHGEMVSPPAGAIGRGDAFLLRIADRSGATILSNDSFQEFHGEYEWLFTKDRLIGGKPVPGIGWIFTPRNPVRGPKSRDSMREARKTKVRIGSKEASRPMPVPKAPPPRPGAATGTARPKAGLSDAIAAATEEVVSPEAPGSGRRRRRRGVGPPPEALNDPLTFIQFIADHPLGSEVEGEVDSFASHGCFITAQGARCYLPLAGMGDPPPRSAREVLNRGERRSFVLQALDPQRRGIELALPGFAHVSGTPQEETVEAEIAVSQPMGERSGSGRARKSAAKKDPVQKASAKRSVATKAPATGTPLPGRAPATKKAPAAAKVMVGAKAPATKKAPVAAKAPVVKKAPAPKKSPAPKKTATKGPATKKPVVKKAPATKKAAIEGPATKKAPVVKNAPAPKKAVVKKAPATTQAAAKAAAPKKATAAKAPAPKKARAAKAPAPKRAAPKRAATKKAVTKRAVTKKAVTKKAAPAELPVKKHGGR